MLRLLVQGLLLSACLHSPVMAQGEADQVRNNLEKLLPAHMEIEAIAESPMPGVYDITAGNQTMFVFARGEFLMIGDIYDIERKVNLGEEKKNQQMLAALTTIPESEMIIMGDVNSDRHVTVFTDTDCGYCQKFHQGISELAQGGLKVRYMMFPRAGLNSASYKEAVSVWCADDQGAAMTTAKNRERVVSRACENPVAKQYQLGQDLGIRGTPTLILDSGKVIPGYVPPANLLTQAGLIPAE